MKDRAAIGRQAEQAACTYLQDRGLVLLQNNYHCRHGEIDLVMREGETTVFVEVRYRRPSAYADGFASVDYHKQNRLIAAARHYLLQHPQAALTPCRFDVISITPQQDKNHIEWLANAFQT